MLSLLLLVVGWAVAHEPGLSYAEIERERIAITFDIDEFSDRFPTGDLEAASLLLVEHTMAATGMSVEGEGCMIGKAKVEPFEEDGVRVTAPLYCERTEGPWTYHASWVRGREAGHRHVVTAFGEPVGVLGPETTDLVLEPGAPPSVLAVAGRFSWMGVEHIAAGFDHLLFVLGLLLAVRSWGNAAAIVTSFTLAHSVTLSAAALGAVRLSPSVVEPLVALSIVWVGLENLFEPPAWRRVLLTFALGLIHGLGFAGALGEVGLPGDLTVLALLGFNVGVEVGQLAFVVLLLPVLLSLRDGDRWERWGVRGGSTVIALIGAAWFFARVLG